MMIKLLNIGIEYIQIAAFFTPVIAVLNISIALMQGLKKPGFTVFISLFKEVIAAIIVFYILSFYFNFQLKGIWSSILIVNYLSVIYFLIILNYRIKSLVLKILKQNKLCNYYKQKINSINGIDIYSITFINDNNFKITFYTYGGYIHNSNYSL